MKEEEEDYNSKLMYFHWQNESSHLIYFINDLIETNSFFTKAKW